MKQLGILVFIVGIVALVLGFGFDTTVEGFDGARVHNIGLMSEKQNIMLFGAALAIVGAIFIGFGSQRTNAAEQESGTRQCPYCAESIKKDAAVCRFCNREIDRQMAAENELTPNELMAKYGILHDGLKYHYARHQYDKFEDALAYAQLCERRAADGRTHEQRT